MPIQIADLGPTVDVAAVRGAEVAVWKSGASHLTAKVTDVRVVGDWAVLQWDVGESGGMSAYHRKPDGSWLRFAHGGGAFAAVDLEKLGVPQAIARRLVPGSPG